MSKPTGNRLLVAIFARCREQILSSSRQVALPVRTQLYWPDEMPQYCYFLTGGIASLIAGLNNGASTEVGLVGNEGVGGAFPVIGPIAPLNGCFMQVQGAATACYFLCCGKRSSSIRRSAIAFSSWSGAKSRAQSGCGLQQAPRGRAAPRTPAPHDPRPHRQRYHRNHAGIRWPDDRHTPHYRQWNCEHHGAQRAASPPARQDHHLRPPAPRKSRMRLLPAAAQVARTALLIGWAAQISLRAGS
jgi:hypothetical protein